MNDTHKALIGTMAVFTLAVGITLLITNVSWFLIAASIFTVTVLVFRLFVKGMA